MYPQKIYPALTPAPMGTQDIASFDRCSPSDRQCFPRARCLLPIIMGSKEHKGEKFEATIKLVNQSFRACTILVADSLYRHILKIGHSQARPELPWKKAQEANQSWLKNNQAACELLTIPHQIIHWKECLNHRGFSTQQKIISEFYEGDLLFQEAVNRSAEEHLDRYLNRNKKFTHFNYEQAFSCCLDYVKEECAGLCLWANSQYPFAVYATERSSAWSMTYERLI